MPYVDPEKRRAYGRGREWMRRNADKAREAIRRWRARHREEHRAARDGYERSHPESASARRKRYRRSHPEVRRVIWQLRRARLASAEGRYTAREWPSWSSDMTTNALTAEDRVLSNPITESR